MRFARRNWTREKTGMTIGVSKVFAALRPLMAMWYLWVRDGWTNVAHAIDAPHAVQAGDGLDRILLLGGHTSAGFGVLTHQIGLVGALSRQLSKSTGRGVEVQAIADVGMTLRALAPRAREMPALWADAVLVTSGYQRRSAPHPGRCLAGTTSNLDRGDPQTHRMGNTDPDRADPAGGDGVGLRPGAGAHRDQPRAGTQR